MKTMFGALRLPVFSLLVLLRPVVASVLSLVGGACLFGFLFCLLFLRDEPAALWSLLGAGVGAVAVIGAYDGLVSLAAPEGTQVFTEV